MTGLAVERVALLFAILIFCGLATFGQVPQAGTLESNVVNTYSNALILLLFGALTLVNIRRTADFLPFSYLLIAFLLLATISALWSVVPELTLRKVASLVTTLLVAIHLTWRFDFAKALTIVGHALLVVLVLSILTVALLPHVGITQVSDASDLAGTWKGVLATKNSLGWICIAGVQIYGWRFLVEPERRLRHLGCLVLFVFVAAETRSATAFICIALSLFLIAVLNLRRWQSAKRVALEWLVMGLVGLAFAVLLLAPASVLDLFGKSADLTGRVPLWLSLMHSIEQRPLLGYGYGGFWVNVNPEMLRVWALNPWKPPNAHNGFLEVTLDLGILGLVIAVLFLIVSTRRALAWCRRPDTRWAVYAGCFLIVFIVTSLDETEFLRGGDLFCLLLAFCYFTLLRQKRQSEAPEAARGGKRGTHGWAIRPLELNPPDASNHSD